MESNIHEVYMVIPPDGGYAWVIVVAAFMSNFAIDGIVYSFGKEMNEISKTLNITESKVAVIGSIQLGLYYMSGPFVSAFVNRYGFRTVAFSGCVIAFIGIFAASYTKSFIGIVFLYGCLGGIGFGMIYAPSVIIIGYYFSKYRALSTGIAVCGSSIGILCLSPLFAYLNEEYSWQITMRIQSAFISICLLSVYAYRELEPTKVPITVDDTDMISATSRAEFVQLYETSSIESIDLPNKSQDSPKIMSQYKPKISIISSRFVPISELEQEVTKDKQRCGRCLQFFLCKWTTRKAQGKEKITNRVIATGPLDRMDIFYSASLMNFPEYKADRSTQTQRNQHTENIKASLTYHISMIHDIKDIRSLIHDPIASLASVDGKMPRTFSLLIKKAFQLLFDVSLLKSPVFCIIAGASFCYIFASFIPYMFITTRAEVNNIPKSYVIWLISCISIGNAVGRIFSGVIVSLRPKLNTCYLVGCFTIFAGIITIISAVLLTDNEIFQIIYCILFGFSIAFLNTLRTIVFVNLLGLDKLTNAFGLSALIMGIAASLGTPLARILTDATGSFLSAFLMVGIFFILSGLLTISAFHVYVWKNEKIPM